MNLDSKLKMDYAYDFEDRYFDYPEDFLTFTNGDFAASGSYMDTWEYLLKERNSLSRVLNFHLYFKDIK